MLNTMETELNYPQACSLFEGGASQLEAEFAKVALTDDIAVTVSSEEHQEFVLLKRRGFSVFRLEGYGDFFREICAKFGCSITANDATGEIPAGSFR